MTLTKILLTGVLMLCLGCSSTSYYVSEDERRLRDEMVEPREELLYQVYLLGDGGAFPDADDPVLNLFKTKLDSAGPNSAAVFLGDNIYPSGMPDSLSPGRSKAEERLIFQLDAVKNFKGRVVILPGNHDWHSDGQVGLKRQEEFAETYLNRGNIFLPDDGFPGPVDIQLMDEDDHPDLREDIRLIVLDTAWWLYDGDKAFGHTGDYDLMDAGDFLVELDMVLRDRRNDQVIVAAHHPMYSGGNHGGYFPLSTHLKPPVLGTLYVAYRKFFGSPQDLANYRYRTLQREFESRFSNHDDLIYVSGHEHTLQYFRKEGKQRNQHYVISGSGSKDDYVATGHGAAFGSDVRGFSVIKFYSDGSSWLEFWAPAATAPEGELLFRTRMGDPYPDPFANKEVSFGQQNIPDYTDSTVTVAANPAYDKSGSVTRFFLGNHNRKLWSVPVEVPVLDIGKIGGGVTPTQVGGYGQSTTLRLENEDGREYVLRSVDKQAGRIWDENLRNTFARDLAQDQFSIIHPYGAFVIPPLAEAAGIYHTNPRLYYVPDDPRLGIYADLMAGQLALLEERPDDDMSHVASMGNAEDVLSSRQMVLEVDADIDHRVDQRAFARARLFDMLIADWDRHPDQWRWGAFEPPDEKGKIYRPIPRDRDVAFMRMDGLFPNIGKYSVFYQYQGFRPSYGNLKGLTLNALGQTRRFTNALTRSDWIEVADSIRAGLSDSVIAAAVKEAWQEPVLEADGERTINTLKTRRDKLTNVARDYYELLAGTVDVVGSHKHEWFAVERISDRETRVTVEKRTREGEFRNVVYERTFNTDETREIRLYGLSGNDRFEVQGDHDNGIRIRVVGGPGPDTFIDETRAGRGSRAYLYDAPDGNTWNAGSGSAVRKVKDPADNNYDYLTSFRYNRTDPLLFWGSNTEDGLFVGGGARIQKHGFQKHPYGQVHTIRANFAAATQAYNLRYEVYFPEKLGGWDLSVNTAVLSPNNIRNYYGLGNETESTEDNARYYQARFSQYGLKTGVIKNLQTGIHVAITPAFEITDFREEENRFITQPQAGISENTFNDQWYGGLEFNLSIESLDRRLNPRQGFTWNNFADINLGLRNTTDAYSTLGSELSVFYSPVLSPQLTFATRFGIAHNIGAFPFFGANTLGSKHNLRGYRSTRFAGRTSAFNNLEVRVKVHEFYSYVLGGEVGLLGFLDTGRVWTDGERSSAWHHGYGGGAWFSLYQMTVLNASVGFSEDGTYYSVGVGFFF